MDNIITYAQKELSDFTQKEFNGVDSLILSCLSYINFPTNIEQVTSWEGIRLADLYLAEYFEEMFNKLWSEQESLQLFAAVCASPRFRNVKAMGYTNQFDSTKEKQFCAITFKLTDSLYYIAFRGTDSSLTGWKEDFNMAFSYPVPAQLEAVSYLFKASLKCDGTLLVGGHSKGGNLAVYSAMNCDMVIQRRLKRIYSHDGPGFVQSVLDSSCFNIIKPKIDKTLPQSSIVGMLLEHQEDFKVVKSNRSSIWQHDPFSWEVKDGDFNYIKKLSADARYFDQTLNTWIRSMSEDDRERFVDSLYQILSTVFPDSSSVLPSDWQHKLPAIIQAATHLNDDTKKFLNRTIKELILLGIRNVPEIFKTEESRYHVIKKLSQ